MSAPIPHRLRRSASTVVDFGSLHETLLIAAVTTVLVIRTQLWLTNYPQLGGGGLHIAHLLWGGLFMLVAIGLLLTFLGRVVRRVAAIVGGVGFGFFIDELGKFVTEDNNYFYRPAAALIYLIFIGLFLLTRALQRHRRLDAGDDLANAVDLLGDAARHDLDQRGQRRALVLLDRADPADPMVAPLRVLFERLDPPPAAAPGRIARASATVRGLAGRFAAWSGFPSLVIWLFGVWAILSFAGTVELVLPMLLELGGAHPAYASDRLGDLEFVNLASIASSLVSAILVGYGALELRHGNRAAAYRSFDRGLLVAILVTRAFAFVESQFGAVFALGIDLALLVALRSVRAGERSEHDEAGLRQPPLAAPASPLAAR